VVPALLACADHGQDAFRRSVVSLYVTHQGYDQYRPWVKLYPKHRQAFAAVVEGPALLTSADMVEDATLVRLGRFGDARRWDARVIHSDPEIDLALVAPEDAGFFDGLKPVRFASSLPTAGVVRSVRWKNGQLETSEGRVARIEVSKNRYSNEHLFLRVRTDVAGGGWSEPVFHAQELAGLTSSQDKDQRAKIFPPEILSAYVENARSGAYRGFASLGIVWQYNRDEAQADFLGSNSPPRGVVIRGTHTGSSSCGVLLPRDILLALDGYEIDGLGNYEHPVYGRIRFTHIAMDGHRPGDVVNARVLRDGEVLDLPIELRTNPSEGRLLPWRRSAAAPAYVVAGGLVFRELDGGYLRLWGDEWKQRAPFELSHRFYLEPNAQTADRRRIVILSAVLPDAYNLGYHDAAGRIVEHVNGFPIDSIGDVERAFEQPREGFHTIRLDPNGERREIVLDAAEFAAATERILDHYGILEASRSASDPLPELGPVCADRR
jgi:hypothetical protein